MVKALPTAASTGRRPCRHCTCWPTPSRRDGMRCTANSGSARPRPLNIDHEGTRFAPPPMAPARSAAATNALDLAVEGGVFLVGRIVRIAQVFLRRHLIGARLAVADRGLAGHLRLVCSAR